MSAAINASDRVAVASILDSPAICPAWVRGAIGGGAIVLPEEGGATTVRAFDGVLERANGKLLPFGEGAWRELRAEDALRFNGHRLALIRRVEPQAPGPSFCAGPARVAAPAPEPPTLRERLSLAQLVLWHAVGALVALCCASVTLVASYRYLASG